VGGQPGFVVLCKLICLENGKLYIYCVQPISYWRKNGEKSRGNALRPLCITNTRTPGPNTECKMYANNVKNSKTSKETWKAGK